MNRDVGKGFGGRLEDRWICKGFFCKITPSSANFRSASPDFGSTRAEKCRVFHISGDSTELKTIKTYGQTSECQAMALDAGIAPYSWAKAFPPDQTVWRIIAASTCSRSKSSIFIQLNTFGIPLPIHKKVLGAEKKHKRTAANTLMS